MNEPIPMTPEARRAILEAEAGGGSALPAEAVASRPSPQSMAAAARELQDQPHISPADAARDAIAKRFAERRGQNLDTSDLEMQSGVQRMLSGSEAAVPIAQPGAQPVARVPQPSAPPANSSDQPLANGQDMVTIVVDGREVAVPAAEVWQEGLRARQKLSTADVRLERASRAEQQIALDRAALDARAAEVDRSRAATPTGVAPDATTGTLPTGAQPIRPSTRKALEALLDSDIDGAAASLDQFVTEQVEARVRAATPRASAAAAPAGEAPSPWSDSDVVRANALFINAFKDIAYNPEIMARAMQRMQQEMANPVNRNGRVDLGLLATQVGLEFMPRAAAPAPPPPPPPANRVVDELAERRSLAARVPGLPPSSMTRSVQPANTGPAPPSRSDIVANMRKARGQAVN